MSFSKKSVDFLEYIQVLNRESEKGTRSKVNKNKSTNGIYNEDKIIMKIKDRYNWFASFLTGEEEGDEWRNLIRPNANMQLLHEYQAVQKLNRNSYVVTIIIFVLLGAWISLVSKNLKELTLIEGILGTAFIIGCIVTNFSAMKVRELADQLFVTPEGFFSRVFNRFFKDRKS